MLNEYIFQVQSLTVEELVMIADFPEKHHADLVKAAIDEIQNRNILPEEEDLIEEHPIDAAYQYAGFFVRLGAYILDAILLTIPIILFEVAIFGSEERISNLKNSLISFIVWIIYRTLMESSSRQATFGKSLVGIKVIHKSGNEISGKIAALRYLSSILSYLPLGFGIFAMFSNEKKQSWHDMISDCYVVYK